MLDFLERLISTLDLETAWRDLCDEMATHGFDRVVYGFTRFSTGNSIGPREDALVLSNHEPRYFKRFMDEHHYEHAPLTRWAMQNTGACSWSRIGEDYNEMTPRERAVVDLNKANGVIAGYSISFPSPSSRARGVIALTARPGLKQAEVDEIWGRDGRQIELKCNVAHLKIASLPHAGVRPGLSRRQIEVLEWVADGKTNLDIATIMGVSAATVEKHLRLAREKLDVDTTAQAVLKATFQNQMFVL